MEEGGRKKGASDAAAEAAAVSHEMQIPVASICRITGAPRSTIYHRRSRGELLGRRPGPATQHSDQEVTALIRQVIGDSPFAGEGHQKFEPGSAETMGPVSERTGAGAASGSGPPAPQRARRRRASRLHSGRITTDAPNLCWGADATMA